VDLIDRIREKNPDYNPREHILSDDLVETKLRREYNFPKNDYKWYQKAIATMPLTLGTAFVTGALTTYLMYPTEVKTILNQIFS